jgi:hypothetical protein
LEKVAFNILARMVLNSLILYKENYRRPGKLKSRYNYTVSIIESLGEEWLLLKDNAGSDDPRRPQRLEKLSEKKESQCNFCSSKERRWRYGPEISSYIYQNLKKNILFLTGLVTRKEDQKDDFIFCLNYVNFKFLYLILSVLFIYFIFFKLFIVLALAGYFCLNLLFIMKKYDFFYMSLTKIVFLVNY